MAIKIINILLASVDGKIATHDKESTEQRRLNRFTNKKDFEHLQKLTAQCDAVLIGAKSMFTEQGAFRVKHLRKNRTEPHWFVMTKSGNIDKTHAFWSQLDIPKSVFHFKDDISDFFELLSKMKIKKIALLGGGELNGFFWKHKLVSDLYLTLSPYVIGQKNAPQLVSCDSVLNTKLSLKNVKRAGSFLFLHYKVE